MRGNDKKSSSLYLEWFLLLLLAGAVSLLFFVGSRMLIEQMIDSYQEKRGLLQRKNQQYIADLQQYVTQHNLSSKDSEKLDTWIRDNRQIYLQIRKDSEWTYFSNMDINDAEWETYDQGTYLRQHSYTVVFSDGEAQVFIIGMYSYDAYMIALLLDTVVSCILFLALTMFGIRRKIQYINQLGRDIEILEGGNLSYEVHIQGNDELTDLAKGLNAMRCSFKNQIEEVDCLTKTNQEMVTEISHDLRTPLTSVLLYAEILQNGKYSGQEEKQKYLEKIIRKIQHMKDLSDRLLQFSVSTTEERYVPADYIPLQGGVYDELSDMCNYLEGQGLSVKVNLLWGKGQVYVNEEYLARILDNISSNILKYADRQALVLIWDEYYMDEICITFENSCDAEQSCKREAVSYGIGIRNIKMMVKEMDGSCEVVQNGELFRICLRLRYKKLNNV